MGISYLCAKELLEKADIYQFASEMRELAEQCFTNNGRDSFSDLVLKYIFQGGVYGSEENQIALDKLKSGSSVAYTIKRLFLPYKSMVVLYPFLKKAPYLLPFCWVVRWVRAIFGGRSKQFISSITSVDNVSDEKIDEIKEICSQLELKM